MSEKEQQLSGSKGPLLVSSGSLLSNSNDDEDFTENPFGFKFSPSVTKCFAQTVTDDQIVFFSGNEYKGEMKEGIIHGTGTYKWKDTGAIYAGTFQWGNLTGVGKISWPDGSIYEGSVQNGVRNGKGKFFSVGSNKFVYDGEWSNGVFHGYGVCYFGEFGCEYRYEGYFVQGQREGKGTMYYASGNIYEGDWHEGKRHGKGKFTWKENGSYYVGEFVNGEMSGKGEIIYAFSAQAPSVQFVQANRYLGDFRDSLRNGVGTFYYANGAVYKGDWLENKKHGYGTFTSRDGRVYTSEFRDGSIFQDGQLFVPTPSISLSFSLDGLLSQSESSDEVMTSLCNIYVRFLPKLRSLYQQYSKIQWADDKTITALRMIGMWRFIQDKGTILEPDFRLCDADAVIKWNLETPSSNKKPNTLKLSTNADPSPLLRSTYGFNIKSVDISPSFHRNEPLKGVPDPFATLFLYQLFESLVRLAHHRLGKTFPDSLILQVTRFLENSIFVEDNSTDNKFSKFRKLISESPFDETITEFSNKLLDIYLDYSGFASGCSSFQSRQLEKAMKLDPNIDVTMSDYNGLMTVRDLILLLGNRGIFDGPELTVMDVLLYIRYSGVSRKVEDDEINTFKACFTSFMNVKITFVEFVQTLMWAADHLITFNWPILMKFQYFVEHIETWTPPSPLPEEAFHADDEDMDKNDD